MNNITQLLEEFNRVNRELNAQIAEHGENFLKELFTMLFNKYPDLKKAAVLGWTPSFNDGDACTHSSEFFTGVHRKITWRSEGGIYFDYEDYGTVQEAFLTGPDGMELNEMETYGQADSEQLQQAKAELIQYSDIFERLYDTNFLVIASLQEDGTVYVDHDYYDPGY